MNGFGERLRKLRREADVTQVELAEMLGVVPSAVGKYERLPNAYPSVVILIKIADYFKVSIDYLLLGKNSASMTENHVNGDLTNSTVIQANRGGQVFNGEATILPETEYIQHVYEKLDVKERLKLLNFVVDLEEKSKKNDREKAV